MWGKKLVACSSHLVSDLLTQTTSNAFVDLKTSKIKRHKIPVVRPCYSASLWHSSDLTWILLNEWWQLQHTTAWTHISPTAGIRRPVGSCLSRPSWRRYIEQQSLGSNLFVARCSPKGSGQPENHQQLLQELDQNCLCSTWKRLFVKCEKLLNFYWFI